MRLLMPHRQGLCSTAAHTAAPHTAAPHTACALARGSAHSQPTPPAPRAHFFHAATLGLTAAATLGLTLAPGSSSQDG